MDENNIGVVSAERRQRRGLTQERLAEMVGVSPPAVSKWETGASCPDADRALDAYGAVAETLGYPPCLLNIQLAARAMERGEGEEALEKLALVARELKGETARSQPLWGRDAPPDPSYYSTLARMLQSDLNRDPGFETLRGDARFQELLRQLDPEA